MSIARINAVSTMSLKYPILLSVTLLALTIAGCGKKGDPLPPLGEPDTYPGQYPKPENRC